MKERLKQNPSLQTTQTQSKRSTLSVLEICVPHFSPFTGSLKGLTRELHDITFSLHKGILAGLKEDREDSWTSFHLVLL